MSVFNDNVTTVIKINSDTGMIIMKDVALAGLVIWTIFANALVFVVLYKNPRLQTVPNLLVGNLAFSDFCLSIIVLPLSAVYAVTLQWSFGKLLCEIWISIDILCCTASIWNLCVIGLDRYWAITSPIKYMIKRNSRSAVIMILSVWGTSGLISLAPYLGWRLLDTYKEISNYQFDNITLTYQCHYLKLPAYTVYSAIGSFYIPLLVMLFVYFQIYRAFADHRARQIYRQKVIRKHIESTILHEISHVLPTSDEFAKDKDGLDDDEDEDEDEDEEDDNEEDDDDDDDDDIAESLKNGSKCPSPSNISTMSYSPKIVAKPGSTYHKNPERIPLRQAKSSPLSVSAKTSVSRKRSALTQRSLTYERVQRHKMRKERRAMLRKSLMKKPKAISAAKEKRGVKVLGIVLGCFTICWFPFFIMYLVLGFCSSNVCGINVHVEQFITWLGYSNSAMNPIIYTVFNREYQTALKKIFSKTPTPGLNSNKVGNKK